MLRTSLCSFFPCFYCCTGHHRFSLPFCPVLSPVFLKHGSCATGEHISLGLPSELQRCSMALTLCEFHRRLMCLVKLEELRYNISYFLLLLTFLPPPPAVLAVYGCAAGPLDHKPGLPCKAVWPAGEFPSCPTAAQCGCSVSH